MVERRKEYNIYKLRLVIESKYRNIKLNDLFRYYDFISQHYQ